MSYEMESILGRDAGWHELLLASCFTRRGKGCEQEQHFFFGTMTYKFTRRPHLRAVDIDSSKTAELRPHHEEGSSYTQSHFCHICLSYMRVQAFASACPGESVWLRD